MSDKDYGDPSTFYFAARDQEVLAAMDLEALEVYENELINHRQRLLTARGNTNDPKKQAQANGLIEQINQDLNRVERFQAEARAAV